jgi:iron-sulfur cluster assembly protein
MLVEVIVFVCVIVIRKWLRVEPKQGDDEMATARPRPQVMRLSEAAATRIKELMAKSDRPIAGLRVGVKNGGCAGMEYTMEYVDSIGPRDEVVEDQGVKIVVDPKAVLFLIGTEMDWKVGKLSSQFVFNNPNQTSACGCGESVQLKPAADGAADAH